MSTHNYDHAWLASLYARKEEAHNLPPDHAILPPPVDKPDPLKRPIGEAALSRGEVAVLVVAGGQGSRLGFDRPKGIFPIGPVTGKSLFQLHAEKVLALSRRFGKPVPFLIMTSHATHDETVAYFAENKDFGLARGQVCYFEQGTMPSLCLHTGDVLMEKPGVPFRSPDGHGGTLTALASTGLLARLKSEGIRHIFYLQVDNPLVNIAEPLFLGHHIAANSEVSSKVISKRNAQERAGVFATVDGCCTIIEYSDLPKHLAAATDEAGRLRLWAGSPATHIFDVGFLERMTADPQGLPLHVARKKVSHVGEPEPQKENALKFERFIFDVLPKAERWVLLEAAREEEFAPVKNAEGDDSPATAKAALVAQAHRWLIAAGAKPEGDVEISPLVALEARDLKGKVSPGQRVTGYLG
jgi:UDP-N-acetylglucosamine/UDP-N-acetylgalactosamine diphosphorylase